MLSHLRMTSFAQKSCMQDQPKQHISAQVLCNLPQFPKINKTPQHQQPRPPHTQTKKTITREIARERGKKQYLLEVW